ncbi:MAG: UDP-N-acetylmuramoyl-L-alanine--D-glutamate ligase [Candidatus Endonucleobacter bathymodioli]|uniref:UDP-N-acetylmuramoylalanine--D-glutamate ligase n=1 Tax=Candidatus Endonucleibacter bathymodioli TaxID=539814 RepID=A0AA90SXY5_9GAMM|nr:UDP-N-acetylmuramoyl-L-alanine--D-glutamate ligase [Candidatus Endonucleobacter bathymodioli]
MSLISTSCNRVVVGLGQTGLSCIRYLSHEGLPFSVVDSRTSPPGLKEFYQHYPEIPIVLGDFNRELLCSADELIVSPGIPLAQPDIAAALAKGVKAIGDIELFCRGVTDVPIVAITGTNGKSTVTTLLGEMARQDGINVAVGGNIGISVLDLLEPRIELYVLELSSFQLETTESLCAEAATVLNISHDHMDRYSSLTAYHRVKQKVYKGCKTAIYNIDDSLSVPLPKYATYRTGFTGDVPDIGQFGLKCEGESIWLYKGMSRLINASRIHIAGHHNYMNVLAALALGEAVGIRLESMLEAICLFTGLPHRCQFIAEARGVRWINDSKATNVGASIAAMEGLGRCNSGKIVLIAGGDGKGADFFAMKDSVKNHVRHLILMGRDAEVLEKQLAGCAAVTRTKSLREAVVVAREVSRFGDVVLLAPACASFDMFTSFEHRGEQFCKIVNEMLSVHMS